LIVEKLIAGKLISQQLISKWLHNVEWRG